MDRIQSSKINFIMKAKQVNENRSIKIVLGEKDFIELVRGNQIDKEDVSIILQDIGFWRMKDIVDAVESSGEMNRHLNSAKRYTRGEN